MKPPRAPPPQYHIFAWWYTTKCWEYVKCRECISGGEDYERKEIGFPLQKHLPQDIVGVMNVFKKTPLKTSTASGNKGKNREAAIPEQKRNLLREVLYKVRRVTFLKRARFSTVSSCLVLWGCVLIIFPERSEPYGLRRQGLQLRT